MNSTLNSKVPFNESAWRYNDCNKYYYILNLSPLNLWLIEKWTNIGLSCSVI